MDGNLFLGLVLKKSKKVILNIKGIGEKKATAIIESLDINMAKKVESTQKEC